MRLFVKSILSAQFFFIYTAFLGKNRGHRRVFCHSKQFILRPLAVRPLAQKVAQPLSRRPAKLAQICRRPHPSFPPLHPSFPPLLPSSPPHLPSCRRPHPSFPPLHPSFPPLHPSSPPHPALLSATAPILPATNYMLISGHETTIAKHDFLISCPETTVSRLAIILKRAAGAMALVSAQGVAYAGDIVITINRI